MSNTNQESILTSIKKMLMITEAETVFDPELILHINTVLNNLTQMGIGVSGGLTITDKNTLWSAFIGDSQKLQQVKTYVYLKVRMIFDPPQNSSLMQALNEQARELEIRLYTESGGY